MGKIGRLDDEFLNDLKEVQKIRIANGKDDKITGVKRLSLAIHRHPLFKNIKEDMKKADLPKSKRGNVNSLMGIMSGTVIFIIVAFIIVIMGAIVVSNFGIITDIVTTIPADNNVTNFSESASITFGNINTALQQFRWWSIMIIFGLAMGLLFSNFLVKIHPAYFIIYIVIVVVLLIFSIIISNSYETLYTGGGTLGDSLQSFKGASWMVLYLPIWVTVISIIGGILLFVNIGRDDSQAGLI